MQRSHLVCSLDLFEVLLGLELILLVRPSTALVWVFLQGSLAISWWEESQGCNRNEKQVKQPLVF